MRLRKEAAAEGLDPNKWFGNVELMVAKDIGQETVQHVSNIYKYYVAYKMAVEQRELREAAKKGIAGQQPIPAMVPMRRVSGLVAFPRGSDTCRVDGHQ